MKNFYGYTGTKRVYFLRCENYVKIGSSVNIEDRVRDLKTGNPFEIEILGAINDNGQAMCGPLETEIHRSLERFRHKNEWFHYDGICKDYITAILLPRVRYFDFRDGFCLNETKRKIKLKLKRYGDNNV